MRFADVGKSSAFGTAPGACFRHGLALRGRPLYFGIRIAEIYEVRIAAAVPKGQAAAGGR